MKNIYNTTVISGTSLLVIAQFELRMVIKIGYLSLLLKIIIKN